ncbi:hypothetical protein NW762_011166 [Fusarium torreyae]|uniref:Inosine/uridine-preferring nucleoside hydrolase domain-containing protein n=1 Tax=Fusarium torreyae TaxID=1237075 RepID=A0A9W8RRJ8_9HYPO|nr:hypothetical protein NW762_011166 [Fusarium torreyae]
MHWYRYLLNTFLAQATQIGATQPKIIIENDWNVNSYVTFLLAIDAGWDVLGLVGNTANSWSRQASLHALALLEIGNLSCIPVHKGADHPLLNTPETFQLWEDLHGPLPYQGVFKKYNATDEKKGRDPSSRDPKRIAPAAFKQGFPNITLAGEHAAAWMADKIRKYPGEVLIYSGGSLTNVALAIRLDPEFAKLSRGLVVMGGYVDVMLQQTRGPKLLADINSDINFKVDPEAAKIALTSNFPKISLVGNGANQVFPDQKYIDQVYQHKTPYTELFYREYGTRLPFWDEIAMFVGLYPEYVTNSTSIFVDVDTAWSSPYYGNIMVYQELFKSRVQNLQLVDYIYEANATALKSSIESAMRCSKCGSWCK